MRTGLDTRMLDEIPRMKSLNSFRRFKRVFRLQLSAWKGREPSGGSRGRGGTFRAAAQACRPRIARVASHAAHLPARIAKGGRVAIGQFLVDAAGYSDGTAHNQNRLESVALRIDAE